MLLIPVMVTAGTETSVELRNAWQRAWAQFRTAQSPIDYIRVSGMGADPMLVNAAQTTRPGRGWWRSVLDMYGAADILVAEVQLQHPYPGGPARARFIARHGPDNEIVGGFTLTAPNSDGVPAMMAEGAQRMDAIFAQALAAGRLSRDPSLNLPPPPPMIERRSQAPPPKPADSPMPFQVQITGKRRDHLQFRHGASADAAGINRRRRSRSTRRYQLRARRLSRERSPARGSARRAGMDRRFRRHRGPDSPGVRQAATASGSAAAQPTQPAQPAPAPQPATNQTGAAE